LLRGAAALGVVGAVGGLGLAGCGSDNPDPDAAPGPDDAASGSGRVLVSMTDAAASLAAGRESRLALGLGDERGTLVRDAPDTLTFEVQDTDGGSVAFGLEIARHDAGLPRAYFPLVVTIDQPGFYRAVTEVDGATVDAAFEVSTEGDIAIPQPGEAFPSVTTPTVADAGGVDPICTQDPPCDLHEIELTTVLGSAPVALLVSTPAFCQTAICGPVLDLFVAAQAAAPDVAFIHVEVFASADAVEAEGLAATLAPAVAALDLPFEPCLFLIGADGVLRRRLDVIYDEVELREGLDALATR
jgi:hypothetical protein